MRDSEQAKAIKTSDLMEEAAQLERLAKLVSDRRRKDTLLNRAALLREEADSLRL